MWPEWVMVKCQKELRIVNHKEQGSHCTCKVTLRRVHETTVACKGNKYYIFLCVCARACVYVCVWVHGRGRVLALLTLLIQHATRKHHSVICGLSGSTIMFTLSHKRNDFQKKLLNAECVFWFFLQLLSFLILRRLQRDIVINMETSSRKVPVILIGF
jgi:hypothetical protein